MTQRPCKKCGNDVLEVYDWKGEIVEINLDKRTFATLRVVDGGALKIEDLWRGHVFHRETCSKGDN